MITAQYRLFLLLLGLIPALGCAFSQSFANPQ